MRTLKKHFLPSFKKIVTSPLFLISLVVGLFFWKVFLKSEVPMPGDFVVGVYHPWIDYKWEGFPAGVPVRNPIMADVPSFIYPMQTLAANMMRSGQFPLWNQLILGGSPLLANFQSAPFSPINVFYFLFDNITSWTIQIILQHIVVAVSMFMLLRHLKCNKLGSLIGGIGFAFSGYNLIWSQWNGHTLTSAGIPLAVLFADRFMKDRRYKDGFFLSLVLFVQIIGGYPQSVFYTLIALGVLWIFKISTISVPIRTSLLLGIFGIFALGLASFQLLPGYELLSTSQREIEPHPYEWAFLPFSKTITFIAADFFGNHATANYWGPQDYTSNTGFVGIILFTTTIFFILSKKIKYKSYFVSLLIVSLALSFPTPLSVFIWKAGLFGMQAASAHRALVLFNFVASAATGLFLSNLSEKKVSFNKTIIIALLLACILGGFAIWVNISEAKSLVNQVSVVGVAMKNLILPTVVLGASFFVLLLYKSKFLSKNIVLLAFGGLMIIELFRFGWKFTPFSPRHLVFPETPEISFLKGIQKPFRVVGADVIPVNMHMNYMIESLEGYDAIYPLRAAKFISAINDEESETKPTGRYAIIDNDTSKLLDLANTKYVLTLKKDKQGNPDPKGQIDSKYVESKYTPVFSDKITTILENKNALPRAFMVYDWEEVTDETLILSKLIDKSFAAKEKIIVEQSPTIAKGNKDSDYKVDYLEYGLQASLIKVQTKQDGMLFISDSFYPGWKVLVDEKLGKIYRANYMFRAVEIPAGIHTIKIYYESESFKIGVMVSVLSAFLLLIFAIPYTYFK